MKLQFFNFLILFSSLLISCEKKENKDEFVLKNGTVKLLILDENEEIVSQAMVVFYGSINNTIGANRIIWDTLYTNYSGIVNYTIDSLNYNNPAGVVILDIKAQKLNKIGQGIIKMETGKINEETVFIQP